MRQEPETPDIVEHIRDVPDALLVGQTTQALPTSKPSNLVTTLQDEVIVGHRVILAVKPSLLQAA